MYIILILQSGDFDWNPGTHKFSNPCTVCNLACKLNHQAVCFDSCELWTINDCAYDDH